MSSALDSVTTSPNRIVPPDTILACNPPSMDQSGEDALDGQAFQILARFTQTHPAQSSRLQLGTRVLSGDSANTSRHYVSSCCSGRPFSQRWSGSLGLT